jgi:acylphosphatase
MPEDFAAIRATVHGRVQGVGFREFVEVRARRLSLVGRVRNLDDGRSVEIVAEGARDALAELLRELHEGPRMSLVDRVEVEWVAPTERYTDFRTAF